jgi:hypothetical protein
MWRLVKWLFVLSVVLLLVVFVAVPLVLSTEKGRRQLESVLGRALGRDVAIGGLDVAPFYTSLKLQALSIANPEGYPAEPFLKAGALKLEASVGKALEGRVEGSFTGAGLELLIQRKGGGSNLDGLGGTRKPSGETGKVPDLDVALELTDSKLTIEDLDKGEKLVLEGVALWMRLSNRADVRSTGIRIRVDSLDKGGIRIRDLQLDAKEADGWLDLEKVEAHLAGQGELLGRGRLQFRGGDEWQLNLGAKGVKLDDDIMPIVGALYPLAAKAEGQADGQLDAAFEVRGHGLTWEAMKPTLLGTGQVTLTGLHLPAGSVIAKLGELAGRPPGAMQINDAGAEFRLDQGWIAFHRLSARTHEARYDLAGRVSLDGQLDLTMDLMPLVKLFGGGDAYREVSKRVDRIPIGIRGTSAKPQFALPKKEDLLRGVLEKTAQEELGGVLDKLKKKGAK